MQDGDREREREREKKRIEKLPRPIHSAIEGRKIGSIDAKVPLTLEFRESGRGRRKTRPLDYGEDTHPPLSPRLQLLERQRVERIGELGARYVPGNANTWTADWLNGLWGYDPLVIVVSQIRAAIHVYRSSPPRVTEARRRRRRRRKRTGWWRKHGVVSSNRTKIISKRRLSASPDGRSPEQSPTVAICVIVRAFFCNVYPCTRMRLRDFFCFSPFVFRN